MERIFNNNFYIQPKSCNTICKNQRLVECNYSECWCDQNSFKMCSELFRKLKLTFVQSLIVQTESKLIISRLIEF